MADEIQTTADWPPKEPAACLYECARCGHEEVWPWSDHYCSECDARGNPPSLMVFRRYATENDCVTDD